MNASAAPSMSLAMVVVREPALPDPEVFRHELAKTTAVTLERVGEAIWALEVDGASTSVALMPAPIPWSELAPACATAWWWPEAAVVCEPCPAHWIVTAKSSHDVIDANLALTRVIAALLRSDLAPAVYWGAGGVIRDAEDFIEQAEGATRDALPLRLWLDLRVEPLEEGDDFLLATTGMKALGHREVETVTTRERADYALDRIYSVAHYLCDKGPILEDGDTIGFTAEEKIRVFLRESRGDRPGGALFLELPE